MDSKKKFQELTIRDNFMFAAVMMQEDNCKHFLEMLLDIEIREVKLSYEKCLIYNPEYKGVRLDVYAADEKNTRYDIEMQIAAQHLGKRVRYYHSQMDMDILESGHDYSELPATYVIFICDFDPFGEGKYCYTFENRCLQDFSLDMGDNSRSIFLSTKGKNVETDDVYVKILQKTIRSVKASKELERSFMTLDEIRQMGKDEGKLEAKREIILRFSQKLGEISESLNARIMSVTDSDMLDAILDLVLSANSMKEFEEKISNL